MEISVKSLIFGLLGYWVITYLYPYALLVLYIYLVTIFHREYTILILRFSISLHGIRAKETITLKIDHLLLFLSSSITQVLSKLVPPLLQDCRKSF